MKRTKKTYSLFQLTSALIMIVALLWLTVSAPFVYASQQELAKQTKETKANSIGGAEEENSGNSLGNTTEEKKPTGSTNISEEYLHHHHIDDNFISTVSLVHQPKNSGIYNAFHGELLVPPPNHI